MTEYYPHLTAPEGGYVFVVTYGRSGSTLIQNLLNGIDGYCIRGENNSVVSCLAGAWSALDSAEPLRGLRKVGQPTGPTQPWYGAELTSPDVFGRGLADAFVRDVLHLPSGTRVGGFKEIRYLQRPPEFKLCMEFLLRFFPGARLVFNTRDHAAVTRSGWWASQPAEQTAKRLQQAEWNFRSVAERYPDRCISLVYDEIIRGPEGFDPLFDFLGEARDHALVRRVLGHRLTHLQGEADLDR